MSVLITVSVYSIKDSIGVGALIEKVVKLHAEDETLELVLGRGIEESHVFVLICCDLATDMTEVSRDVNESRRKDMQFTGMSERGNSILLFGILRTRPAITDVVSHFQPLDRGNRDIAMQIIVAVPVLVNLLSNSLFTFTETIAYICT